MQGTLNEIDIRSILQLIELGQRTGELFVQPYPKTTYLSMGRFWNSAEHQRTLSLKKELSAHFWFIFFVNGQIAYAADQNNSHNLLRLRDYLRRYKVETQLKDLSISAIETTNTPEYACIWSLLEKNILTPAQSRHIIESMIQETLFDLFNLPQGGFIFEMSSSIAPQLTTLEIGTQITQIMKQVQKWKEFHPYIQHPEQYVVITAQENLKKAVPDKIYQNLCRWAKVKSSLRQLSRYLNQDIVVIARALYPYAQRGWLQLASPTVKKTALPQDNKETQDSSSVPHIVCIDDDLAIRENVDYILKENGYKSTAIGDPIQALSEIFLISPNLILCDIAMPKLDGYELCAMLRQSSAFRQIPIIMLTGQETFINRVRARMVGATDYLTKPFGASELLLLLEKYTGTDNPLRTQLTSLSDKSQDA
ncbi:response regulator receiver protein [Gloeothece citriformis PCC 7424]|uniref:Protein PatA n=1 Tax=Gloeothece citriformis (strain PCC 7424) TaxID=65393 RepID=B7KA45_GLOC7|nr:response regulator receiver protein [Gloeothece citriformis PCC 7424]